MIERCGRSVIVAMLILATGGHWVLLQSVAWVSMTVQFSQVEPISSALKKTFDGQHPCSLCKVVDEGLRKETHQKLQKPEIKLDLFCDRRAVSVECPLPGLATRFSAFHLTDYQPVPPEPPPRLG
jgi:hypothetical protein